MEWSYKAGGLCMEWSYKAGGLCMEWSYKPWTTVQENILNSDIGEELEF